MAAERENYWDNIYSQPEINDKGCISIQQFSVNQTMHWWNLIWSMHWWILMVVPLVCRPSTPLPFGPWQKMVTCSVQRTFNKISWFIFFSAHQYDTTIHLASSTIDLIHFGFTISQSSPRHLRVLAQYLSWVHWPCIIYSEAPIYDASRKHIFIFEF